ncbi:hypothetical protein [Nocardia sp. NPDC049707]|uniref:hypothetical protein n=1 Tax=Nocardia sp. NPDC049707 TaxID=3154735 RepID=UPI00343B34B6
MARFVVPSADCPNSHPRRRSRAHPRRRGLFKANAGRLWQDLPDHDRYAVVLDHAAVADGVGAEQLAAMVETTIAA